MLSHNTAASCFSFNCRNEKLSSRCDMPEDDDGQVHVKLIRLQFAAVLRDCNHKATSARLKMLLKLLVKLPSWPADFSAESRVVTLWNKSFHQVSSPSSPASLSLPFPPSLPSPDPAIWGKQMILMRDGSKSPGTERARACVPPLIVRHRPRCPVPDTDTVCCANMMNGALR